MGSWTNNNRFPLSIFINQTLGGGTDDFFTLNHKHRMYMNKYKPYGAKFYREFLREVTERLDFNQYTSIISRLSCESVRNCNRHFNSAKYPDVGAKKNLLGMWNDVIKKNWKDFASLRLRLPAVSERLEIDAEPSWDFPEWIQKLMSGILSTMTPTPTDMVIPLSMLSSSVVMKLFGFPYSERGVLDAAIYFQENPDLVNRMNGDNLSESDYFQPTLVPDIDDDYDATSLPEKLLRELPGLTGIFDTKLRMSRDIIFNSPMPILEDIKAGINYRLDFLRQVLTEDVPAELPTAKEWLKELLRGSKDEIEQAANNLETVINDPNMEISLKVANADMIITNNLGINQVLSYSAAQFIGQKIAPEILKVAIPTAGGLTVGGNSAAPSLIWKAAAWNPMVMVGATIMISCLIPGLIWGDSPTKQKEKEKEQGLICLAYVYCRNNTNVDDTYSIHKAVLVTEEKEWVKDIQAMRLETDGNWPEEFGIIYSMENEPIWGYDFVADSIIEEEDEIRRIYLQMMAQREVYYVPDAPSTAKYMWYAEPNDDSGRYE
ncbi:hypothetical protein [Dapis sp. BLCC M229]|uniref:hypothetical protein n=1 Tax=Dapis sp. BLCC M229 TaxID=3400188 RepID=UPI003CF7A486